MAQVKYKAHDQFYRASMFFMTDKQLKAYIRLTKVK